MKSELSLREMQIIVAALVSYLDEGCPWMHEHVPDARDHIREANDQNVADVRALKEKLEAIDGVITR